MEKNRLEAFSDGVIAIIITIMVLELKAPLTDEWDKLKELLPVFLSYILSFIYVGIYWNNHHHMLHSTQRVTGGILWANQHLLFWLSLFPFTTAWIDEHHNAALPVAVYGFVLLMAAVAYFILQGRIIAQQGKNSLLARAVGKDWKGRDWQNKDGQGERRGRRGERGQSEGGPGSTPASASQVPGDGAKAQQ